MTVPLLDLRAQYLPLREEIRAVMDEVCDAQAFILGPKVTAFEAHVAAYCGVRETIGVSSGTDALLVALMALGIGPGDGVVTSPFSFFATAGSIVRLGAVPIFADIDPVTYNLDPEQAHRAIKAASSRFPGIKVKALMPVHLFGQAADMDALMSVAEAFGLRVIEDACQSIGAEYPGQAGVWKTGAIGDAGCYSFFPSKNLGCFGDGGMVSVQDAALGSRIRELRNHGMEPKYYHRHIGGNFRIDALQAAILDIKLRYLEDWHAGRRTNAARYDQLLAGTAVQTPAAMYRDSKAKNFHIYNQYVVRVPQRDRVRQALTAAGVGCEVYYPVPLHQQECFQDLGYKTGDFPESEKAAAEVLALPVYPELTEAMQVYVAEQLIQAVGI
ncbi:MAG TPA: transcriptional regulator [Verrucomicrobia bacterium]|nr:transcriptional regulator [Verrucomicrobiota bacterium]